MKKITLLKYASLLLSVSLLATTAKAGNDLPTHGELRKALKSVIGAEINGGAGLELWGVVVDRDGVVRRVAFSGKDRHAQLPIGRVVTAAKASTVNGLSLNNFVISNPQLSSAVQANGLFQNLPDAHPVSSIAYRGPAKFFGTRKDPMIGQIVGGATALGGGLALYNDHGEIIGAMAVGGEVHPCADHNAVWIMRDALGLDNLPEGIGFSPTGDDNIIYDIDEEGNSASGFGTIECSPEATAISEALPINHPIGSN